MPQVLIDFRIPNRDCPSMNQRSAQVHNLSRVPIAGEHIQIGVEIFTVHQVLHYTSFEEPQARIEVR